MFYRRNTKLSAPVVRTFKINAFGGYATGVGENTLDLGRSKYCLNYVARDGELTQTFGTRSEWLDFETGLNYPITTPKTQLRGMYQYEYTKDGVSDDRLMLYLQNGALYCLYVDRDDRTPHLIKDYLGTIYGAFSYQLEGEDVLLIASRTGFYVLRDTTLSLVEGAPDLRHFCLHAERAFGATMSEPYKLWFSTSLNPLNWNISIDGGGFIEFSKDNGAIKKVVSFMGYLYVFREYGIERVTTYGDQTEFEVRSLYFCSDRIYQNTVCVCGDKILFMSEKGLHTFDGANVNKISGVIESEDFIGRGDNAVATYYKGNYMLAVYVKRFDDDEYKNSYPKAYVNNCIICVCLDDGAISVMSEYDVSQFCIYKSERGSNLIMVLSLDAQTEFTRFMLLDEAKCGRMGSVTYYYWKTGMTDMGYPEKKKMLRDITIAVSGTTHVTVMLDDLEIKLGRVTNRQKTFRVMRPFQRFGFKLTGYGSNIQRISPPVVRVDMR